MQALMENPEYYARLRCADEEKRACLTEVRQLTRAVYLAYRHGILALEKLEEEAISPFFRDCLELVMNGPESEELDGLLARMLHESDCRGQELFRKILILEGVAVAYHGEDRSALAQNFAAWFGDGWRDTVFDTVYQEWERIARKPEAREISACPEFDTLVTLPEDRRDALIRKYCDAGFLPCRTLVWALSDAAPAVRKHLLSGLSEERREQMEQAIAGAWISWPEEREQAQREIVGWALGEERG